MQSCEEGADDEHDHDERSSRVDGGVGRPRRGARGGAPAVPEGWRCVVRPHDSRDHESLAQAAPFCSGLSWGHVWSHYFRKKGHFGSAASIPAADCARIASKMHECTLTIPQKQTSANDSSASFSPRCWSMDKVVLATASTTHILYHGDITTGEGGPDPASRVAGTAMATLAGNETKQGVKSWMPIGEEIPHKLLQILSSWEPNERP